VLFAAAFIVGAVFQSRAALGAERAASAGHDGAAARQLRRWTLGDGPDPRAPLLTTWDMVIKPGL